MLLQTPVHSAGCTRRVSAPSGVQEKGDKVGITEFQGAQGGSSGPFPVITTNQEPKSKYCFQTTLQW